MDVRLPNGVLIRNVPDGTSKEEIKQKAIAKGLASPKDFPLSLGGELKEGFTRFGEGIADLAETVGLGGLLGYRKGQIKSGIAERRGNVPEAHGLGKVARIGAEYAPGFLVPGGKGAMAARIAKNALIGAGLSAAQYTPEGESKLTQALTGAALGGAVPEALGALGAGFRGAVGARDAGKMQANLAAFERSGVEPTVGQVTGSRSLQGMETVLGKSPGARGIMTKRVEAQQGALGGKSDSIIKGLARGSDVSPYEAGETVKKGIQEYVSDFKAKSEANYDRLYNKIDPQARVSISNTLDAASDIVSPVKGAEKSTKALVPGDLRKQIQAIIADAQDGQLPMEGVRKVRSLIGDKLDNNLLASEAKSHYKRMYAALTSDIEQAASTFGAKAEYEHANAFHREGRRLIDKTLNRINNIAEPERVFSTIMAGTRDGAQKLAKMKNVLSKPQWDLVAATQVRKMGTRVQDGEEIFSSGTFLGNWGRLHKQAKDVLFTDKQYIKDIDDLVKVSGSISEQARQLANPSGTAGALWNQIISPQSAGIAYLVDPTLAASIVGYALASNGAARLMTNKKVVRWMAQGLEIKEPSQMRQWLGRATALGLNDIVQGGNP